MEHHQFIVDFPWFSQLQSFIYFVDFRLCPGLPGLITGGPPIPTICARDITSIVEETWKTKHQRIEVYFPHHGEPTGEEFDTKKHASPKHENTKPQGLTCRQFQEFTAKTTMNVWWSCFFTAQVGDWHRANTCYSCVPWSKDRIWIQTPNIMGWCPPACNPH
jgi:hypothetical protein